MAVIKEKEKNILILSMSTLHSNMELNHYYGEGANGDYRFDGVSQLEAGTKYLLHYLADKGQRIDRIIVLNTCQTYGEDAKIWDATKLSSYLYEPESLGATGFYEKRIREYLQFGDKKADIEKNLRDAGVGEELAVAVRDYITSGMSAFYDVEYSKAKEMIDKANGDIRNAEFKKYANQRNKMINEECLRMLEAYTHNVGKDGDGPALENVIRSYEDQMANTRKALETEEKAVSLYVREYIYGFLNANDCFKHKKHDNRKALELLYPQIPNRLFEHILLEYKTEDGKFQKDDMTVKKLCDILLELKGTTENLHVYIDSQGGERTFIHTVNAAIDLLSNRNVTIEEIIATNYSKEKIVNKIRFVTKDYAIADLGAGMKAFIRYGKAEELLSYLDKKGLGETANEKKLIDIIKGIDESIQVSDPVGLYDNLNELKVHPELLDENSYRDVNIRIVVEDIKRDYARLLDEDSSVVDVIEWLSKKSLMIQTLTFIEDKIPEYLLGERQIIRLEHSHETELIALHKNGWKKNGETRLANGFVKEINGKLLEWNRNQYMNRVSGILLQAYLDAYYDEIVSKLDFTSLPLNTGTDPKMKSANADKNTMIKLLADSFFIKAITRVKNGKTQVSTEYDDACELMKLLDVGGKSYFSEAIQSDEKVYFKMLRVLIEHYQHHVNHKEFSIEEYIAMRDCDLGQRLAALAEELSDVTASDEEAIWKYIEYRDVAGDYERDKQFNQQSDLYENPLFYVEELGGEFKELYKEISLFLWDDNYFYQTVAGIRDANIIGDVKLDSIHIAPGVDRGKLEKVLLLHKALKNERNNTNHASERSLRLPLWVVKRMIEIYIGLIRDL